MKKSRTAGRRTKGREREKRIGRGGGDGGRKLVWGREREREMEKKGISRVRHIAAEDEKGDSARKKDSRTLKSGMGAWVG